MTDTVSESSLAKENLCQICIANKRKMILRAGGSEAAAAYLDRARERGNLETLGNWHIFPEIDPDQPQSSVLLLYGGPGGERAEVYANEGMPHLRGIDTEFGLCGNAGMINMGRYVAVAPRNVAMGVRNLSFGGG